MNSRNVIIAVITAVIVVVAWQTSQKNAPTTELVSERLYPDLIERLNDVQSVKIQSAASITELVRSGENWVVANRDNFPATFATVKNTLINLADATVIEEKTSKPERYARIGVGDISEPDSKAVRLEIDAGSGDQLATVLIGNERSGSQLNARQFYVRKTDAAAALLVEGELNVKDDPADWMDSAVVNVATARVRQVSITPADGPQVVVTKQKAGDNFFTLSDIPTGFEAKSRSVVSSLGAMLLDVKFDNVAAQSRVGASSPIATAEVRTFDGLIGTMERFELDGESFVRFRFAFDEAGIVADPVTADESESRATTDQADADKEMSVTDEVAGLNEKTQAWVYALPDYKDRMLEKRLDDMIKPVEEKPAATTAEGSDEG